MLVRLRVLMFGNRLVGSPVMFAPRPFPSHRPRPARAFLPSARRVKALRRWGQLELHMSVPAGPSAQPPGGGTAQVRAGEENDQVGFGGGTACVTSPRSTSQSWVSFQQSNSLATNHTSESTKQYIRGPNYPPSDPKSPTKVSTYTDHD